MFRVVFGSSVGRMDEFEEGKGRLLEAWRFMQFVEAVHRVFKAVLSEGHEE